MNDIVGSGLSLETIQALQCEVTASDTRYKGRDTLLEKLADEEKKAVKDS